jgi:hypothetical protein
MNTALHNLRFLYEDTTLNAVPREIFESLIRPELTEQDFLKYRTCIMFLFNKLLTHQSIFCCVHCKLY